MSIIRADTGSPPCVGPLHQSAQLALHVAAVVQAGELVGDRHLQRVIEIVAQEVGVALALDLGAGAGGQLLRVDRGLAACR
jgi:hypothetical protein